MPRGCPGCIVVTVGLESQSHSAERRTRIDQLMGEDAQRGGFERIVGEEVERPRSSTSRYGTRGVNVAGNTSGRRQDEKMEEAEEARSSHEAKRHHWWKKLEQVRRVGEAWLEDHDVAVEEIGHMWRHMLLLGSLDANGVEVIEFFSFRRFSRMSQIGDRPQLGEVSVGGRSTSRLRVLYLDRLCAPPSDLQGFNDRIKRENTLKVEVKYLEFCSAVHL